MRLAASQQFDLVVGGGMAGLTAAARSSRDGSTVVLVERASGFGESARYAGYLWTAPSNEVLADVVTRTATRRCATLVAGFASGGVAALVGCRRRRGGFRSCATAVAGASMATAAYIAACEKLVTEQGEIHQDTTVEALLADAGAVTGLDVRTADGSQRRITATSTLLASGGCQGVAS